MCIRDRSSGMDIIAGKTDEIHQQEHPRKTKIYLTVTLQIEPHPECNGNRYPTEIEYPGKEIGKDVYKRQGYNGRNRRSLYGYTVKNICQLA